MRLLTKFWIDTPAGKLVFNRDGKFAWRMSSTKGQMDSVKCVLPYEEVIAEDVLRNFGWPGVFKPYGQVYEGVSAPKKVKPFMVIPGNTDVWVLTRGGDALIFSSRGEFDLYLAQQQGGK